MRMLSLLTGSFLCLAALQLPADAFAAPKKKPSTGLTDAQCTALQKAFNALKPFQKTALCLSGGIAAGSTVAGIPGQDPVQSCETENQSCLASYKETKFNKRICKVRIPPGVTEAIDCKPSFAAANKCSKELERQQLAAYKLYGTELTCAEAQKGFVNWFLNDPAVNYFYDAFESPQCATFVAQCVAVQNLLAAREEAERNIQNPPDTDPPPSDPE